MLLLNIALSSDHDISVLTQPWSSSKLLSCCGKTGPHSVDGMTGPVDLASWEDVMAEEKCSANGSEIGGKG
jgi:hypothetical protein